MKNHSFIKPLTLLTLLGLGVSFSSRAQTIKENIQKQGADSDNKIRAAKADVYIMDKTIMEAPVTNTKTAVPVTTSSSTANKKKHSAKKKKGAKQHKTCRSNNN